MAHLAWLVERGVFKNIYCTFLPVGHTHFGPDRIGSRIAVAVQHQDVHTFSKLAELIEQSHCHKPVVEMIHQCADWKSFFNPKIRDPMRGQTSSLHFRFTKTVRGNVCIQDKQTCDAPDWSSPFYPSVGQNRQNQSGFPWVGQNQC